jgi:glycosyltransferase involved in cell wall biosynthesis
MRKKKILIITENKFPPDIRIIKQVISLNQKDYECAVLAPLFSNQKKYEVWKKIKIFRDESLNKNFLNKLYLKLILFIPRWFFVIGKVVKIYQPDAIQIIDIWLGKSAFAATKSIPVILDLHENIPAAVDQYLKDVKGIRYFINKIFFNYRRLLLYERILCNKASLVLVVAKEAYKRVLIDHKELPKKKLILVENFESKKFIKIPILKKRVFSRKYFNITYIGSFGPHRGIDTLIKSFIYIKKTNLKIKLNLVGAEENIFLDYLKKLIISHDLSKYVQIIGWIDSKDVMTYISQSDICTVPHKSNRHTDTTLPWKLSQYMFAKKPVLVSSCPPLAKIVKKASAGMIFKENNPKDCANKILIMKENYKDLLKYGQNGYAYVFKNGNNWECKSSVHLIKAYDKILKDSD